MLHNKKEHPKEKSEFHPRNRHRERYDFKTLIRSCPELEQYLKLNPYKDESIDFFDPDAVKMLNKALLLHYYNLQYWDIPANYLCPPVPGRADYIHYAADLLAECNKGVIPKGLKIKCLDIGVGANCIYPIIGSKEYNWSFTGTDVDPVALESAEKIIESNPILKGKIELRLQENKNDILRGIIRKSDRFDLVVCNPPFHASAEEAKAATIRKQSNLKHKKISNPTLNFGGQSNELWYLGGQERFVEKMIQQSNEFPSSCFWFSTLISKQSNLEAAYNFLRESDALEVKTTPMGQGNKTSRILAWTFLNPQEKDEWAKMRWNSI
jgi:23S rRNA (adenine1618-N6)-methyltransferase